MTSETQLREAICAYGRSMFERGLTFGSSGNISVRLHDGWLMTPSGCAMGMLDPADLSKLDHDGNHISGLKPTKETFLHFAMYCERRDDNAVVHLHSTHSVAVSCLSGIDAEDALPPITAYYVMRIGQLPLLPYYPPGDPELGKVVGRIAGKHHAILLANHGPVVSGKSLSDAVFAIEELEETAKLYLLLREKPTRFLNAEQRAALEQRKG